MEEFFIDNDSNGLQILQEMCDNIGMYLKLFIILYADDTVLMAESADGLQSALDTFEIYCNIWKLTVNTQKTKVVIFSKRKVNTHFHFLLCNEELEIIESFSYLGVLFDYNGNFTKAKSKLAEQAKKALFAVYRKIRNISLPVDLQLKIFDSLVQPILLYSAEVWGFENTNCIEKIHLQFCKRILSLRYSTANFMVYGEIGRYPLIIEIQCRMIMFWHKLISCNKLSSNIYKLIYHLHENESKTFKWISYVKPVLNDTGLNFVWNLQESCTISKENLKVVLKQRLQDQFIQKWFNEIE